MTLLDRKEDWDDPRRARMMIQEVARALMPPGAKRVTMDIQTGEVVVEYGAADEGPQDTPTTDP